MTDAVSLPFSSQQQLLARLLHLSRLDTDFILLTGPEGAGKSHLADRLTEETTLMLPTLLDAEALDSHARFRDALLGSWFPGTVFDSEDTLPDSMARLLPTSLHKRLLVVDNAEWLTDILLQELVQLYLALPAAVRPFMVLLGSADWAGLVRRRLDDVMKPRVLEVEVPPLTEADKKDLWQALGYQSPPAASHDIQYPGDVIDTMEPQMKTQGYRQLMEQKSVKILLTALIVVVLLIIIVRLLGGAEAPAPELARPFEQESELALPPPVPAEAGAFDAGASASSGDSLVREWPVESLPETPAINTRVAETPDDSDKERVVIEDKVVSKLMQRKAAPEPSAKAAASAKPASAKNGELSPLSALMQKPGGRYTLQLMAGRDRAGLEKLAFRHTLTPAWVYPRSINGQPWFVLVFGDFDSPVQARGAIGMLSSDLQSAKPWPKPFAQVQKEVKP
ncbi:SPOR domain-containing protein [Oceanisphaera sp. KMM 10153]|uniref:SPOR domain-containing protein n=1 Tax=Oceanisphaera submarina TaxID=3390193 RepID=UPI003975296C